MKKLNIILSVAILLSLLLTTLASAEIFDPKGEDDCLYYFYGADCSDCKSTDALIAKIEVKYPNVELQKFEVYHNANNVELLNKYFQAYNIAQNKQGIPAIFSKNSYLIGKKTLSNYLENLIIDNDNAICPNLDAQNVMGIANEKEPSDVMQAITSFSIMGSVLKDSFRPVMIALLILFILGLATFKNVSKSVLAGCLFVVGSFTAFLLYATNIIEPWGSLSTQAIVTKIIIILAIVLSIIKIIGFFVIKKDYIQDMQKEQRVKVQKTFNILHHPIWYLLLSFILSMFALAGTGKMFSLLKTLHSEGLLSSQVIPWIIYAVIVMLIPTIITLILMTLIKNKLEARSSSTEPYSDKRINEWRTHNHKILNVVISLLVIVICLFLLYV